jgi:molybdopterin synthase sulfur carrier subunit
LAELLGDVDRHFPGFRFRIITEQDEVREHIKLFVNQEQVRDLAAPLQPADEVDIVCALSGG